MANQKEPGWVRSDVAALLGPALKMQDSFFHKAAPPTRLMACLNCRVAASNAVAFGDGGLGCHIDCGRPDTGTHPQALRAHSAALRTGFEAATWSAAVVIEGVSRVGVRGAPYVRMDHAIASVITHL